MKTDEFTGLQYEPVKIQQKLSINDQIKAIRRCKVYISGKITGIEARAKEDFAKAERALNAKGFTAVNPFSFNHDHDQSWESYMRVCITELMKCDAIYMLDGWKHSKGAVMEHHLAMDLDLIFIRAQKKVACTKKQNTNPKPDWLK